MKKLMSFLFAVVLLLIISGNIIAGNVTSPSNSLKGIDTTKYLISADEMPQMVGSMEDFAKRIIYPETAKQAGMQGKVLVKAFIDEKGKVVETLIVSSVSPELDASASKAVKETKFKPAKVKGHTVKAQVILPVSFKLQ